jgi:hypothetical protein
VAPAVLVDLARVGLAGQAVTSGCPVASKLDKLYPERAAHLEADVLLATGDP